MRLVIGEMVGHVAEGRTGEEYATLHVADNSPVENRRMDFPYDEIKDARGDYFSSAEDAISSGF